MKAQLEATQRDAVLVEDAAQIRMMGFPILEALPSREVPYEQVDPFILVHEGRLRLSDMKGVDTKHPHRGFDNLWYVIEGSASTGHSTGPGGAMERARLSEGALLALRTGRGAWHAEAIGADELEEGQADAEFRGVLFWVNLARKDKQVEPSAQVLQPEQVPVRQEGDATVRVLVGEGSPVRLGTPALILDVELPAGGEVTTPVPPEFQGFAYMLEGEAAFGANGDRRGLRSSSSSVAVTSSRSPMPPPALGTCSWPGAVRRGPRVQRAVRGLDDRVFGLDERIAASSDGASIWIVLAVAVLLGLRHATDPDHLAAVTTLVASGRERAACRAGELGLAWGLGHAATLFAFGLPVLLLNRRSSAPGSAGGGDGDRIRHRLPRAPAPPSLAPRRAPLPRASARARCANALGSLRDRARARHGGSAGVGVLVLASVRSTGLAVARSLSWPSSRPSP